MGHFTYISCDATHDAATGYAAVAACLPGRPLAAKIVQVENTCEAERRAILLAIDAAASRIIRFAEFRSDAEGAISRIIGERDADALTKQIRARLKKPVNNGLWQVACVPRSAVEPAHLLASLTWKAFVAGKEVHLGVPA